MLRTQHTTEKTAISARPFVISPAGDACQAPAQRQRWEALAKAVVRRAIDDAAAGEPVELADLREWAALAGLPWNSVERAIRSASESSPATAA